MENYFSLHNTVIYPRPGNQQRLLPPKKNSDMCMGWQALHASLGVVCPRLIVSNKAEKSIEPSHKLGEKSSLMQNLLSNSQGEK